MLNLAIVILGHKTPIVQFTSLVVLIAILHFYLFIYLQHVVLCTSVSMVHQTCSQLTKLEPLTRIAFSSVTGAGYAVLSRSSCLHDVLFGAVGL